MFKFLVLSLTLAVTSAIPLSNERISPFLTNGTKSEPGEFPYLAHITIKQPLKNDIYDSGVLISDKYVLAEAEHLTPDSEIFVTLGASFPLATETEQQRIQVHFNDIIFSDLIIAGRRIAILKLSTPAELNERVQPVLLPRLSEKGSEYMWQTGTVAAWIGTGPTKQAAHQTVLIEDNLMCGISNYDPIVCVAYPMMNTGDKGAPLLKETADGHVLIGLYGFLNFVQREQTVTNVLFKINEQLEFISRNTGIVIRP